MTYIQKFTLGIIFTFFSINMLGCSGGGSTTVSKSPPTIQVSLPSNFDFGTVTQGNIASPQEIIITNVGSEELNVSKISISDTSNFELNPNSGTNYCNTTDQRLFTDESCTIEVTFNPVQFNAIPTSITTALTIKSNDPNTPDKILNLAGTSELVSNTLTVTINQVDTAACNVTAYVSVTDQQNFPVEGLSAADFTITEGASAPISPTSTTVGNANSLEPISIAIVMDNSSSMQDIDIAEMNKAAIDVVSQLGSADEVEIIKFNAAVSVVQPFTADINLLTTAINSPFVDDGTALYEALQQAITDTEAQTTERKAIIVITDGADNQKTSTLSNVINAAQASDIPIFVIALGNFVQSIIDNVLTPIADDTSGELYEADVAQNFSTIIEQKLTEVLFVDQYILNYASVSTGGTVDLTIDVSDSSRGLSGTSSKQIPSCP